MKAFLTIKRTKAGIAINAEHDSLATANEYTYQKNASEPEAGHVYETWTREEWQGSSERKA